MTELLVFALPNPWAFYDWKGPPELRRQRLGAAAVTMLSGGPLYIAAPDGKRLTAGGRRRGVQIETAPFKLPEGSYALNVVSVGTRPEEKRIHIFHAGVAVGEIELRGHLPRPGWAAGRQGGAPTSIRAEALDRFIELTIERIRTGESVSPGQIAWERAAEAWMTDEGRVRDPPRSLIVRHAERMRGIIADINDRPRRLLRRRHEMIRVERVQQIDAACIQWLSRQPGHDVFERAGPRQRILAIAREETIDTLENRVLRDFVERSREVARRYLKRYERLSSSARMRLVKGYADECARITRDLELRGVARAKPPVVPNYALLQERRYRLLWRAYRELLKHIDDQDESWRWQHRLWADFCRVAVHVALRKVADPEGVVAESPLRIAPEQMRGCWSLLGPQSGVFLLAHNGHRFAVSVLADITRSHPMARPWMSSLGALAALHIQVLDNRRQVWIVIWPMHEAGDQVAGLAELVQSAERALVDRLQELKRYYDEDVVAGGVVLGSMVDPHTEETDGNASFRHGVVCGLRLSPESPFLATGLRRLAEAILTLAHDLTC